MSENKHFIREEFKKWAVSSLFVAMAAMAVIMSPMGDNLNDIWNSPQRLEVIEADIDRINESLALLTTDDDEDSSLALND